MALNRYVTQFDRIIHLVEIVRGWCSGFRRERRLNSLSQPQRVLAFDQHVEVELPPDDVVVLQVQRNVDDQPSRCAVASLERSNRLSIISPRAFCSTFVSFPGESRKPAGTTDARVQCGRAANTGPVCRKRRSRYNRRQTSHAADCATTSPPAPIQFCGQSLLIFGTLAQDLEFSGHAAFWRQQRSQTRRASEG